MSAQGRTLWRITAGMLLGGLFFYWWSRPPEQEVVSGAPEGLLSTQSHPPAPPLFQPASTDAMTPEALSLPAAPAPGEVDAGHGMTIKDFMARVQQAAPQRLHLDLPPAAPHFNLRLTAYSGPASLPLDEAAAVLIHLGLILTSEGDTLRVALPDPSTQLWRTLTHDADPLGPQWGALRPWQALSLKADDDLSALLAAEPSVARLHFLNWLQGGLERTIEIGPDGAVVRVPTASLSADQQQQLSQLFLRCAAAPDSKLRCAAAAGLGEILRHQTPATLPADEPHLAALARLLEDPEPLVHGAAALALGSCPALPAVEMLAGALGNWHGQPASQAFALAAIWQSNLAGRRLELNQLDTAGSEQMRALYARLRIMLLELPENQPGSLPLEWAAAWLRAAEVFGLAEQAAFSAGLRQRLWDSGALYPQLAAAAVTPQIDAALRARFTAPVHLAFVAGPLWTRELFDYQQALEWLQGEQPHRWQAALWRLSRLERRPLSPPVALVESLAARLELIAGQNPAALPRRLALEALYLPRFRVVDGQRDQWRLLWSRELALEVFLNDPHAGVQTSAAEIIARLTSGPELDTLNRENLTSRAPEALVRLLSLLAPRWRASASASVSDAPPEYLNAAIAAFAENLIFSAPNPVCAGRAAWLRVQAPGLDFDARVRLAGGFKQPYARAGGIEGLAVSKPEAGLTVRHLLFLLKDTEPSVRSAVFAADLVESLEPSASRARFYLQGLDDAATEVRLAALQALTRHAGPVAPELHARLRQLATEDTLPAVRLAASRLAHRDTAE